MKNKLTQDDLRRYSRHILLPEVGEAGQEKLASARVLIVGAGGLGSPAALYLAAAGVGAIGLVDFDVVDISNLQRQLLHSTPDVGKSKLDSAKKRIYEINPGITLNTYYLTLNSDNAMDILKDYDIIIDGTDNFPSRYLINDAAVFLKKPYVYGSVFRFEGQVSVFYAKKGPCYRCLYPSPPPPGLVPNCAEGGVLGVLPGIIGTLQALEAIKLILNIGSSMIGRMTLFNGLTTEFQELKLKKDPACPVCGTHPTITRLIDYEDFCGLKSSQNSMSLNITPKELKSNLENGKDIFIVDVREPYEYEIANIGGELMPLGKLQLYINLIPREKEIVVLCHHGVRSARAAEFLRDSGFPIVKNLIGGINAWSLEVDPKIPRY